MRSSPQGVLALLTLAALARGVAWKAAAQATAGRLRSSAALASCASRLAPLLQVRPQITAAARYKAWRRSHSLRTQFLPHGMPDTIANPADVLLQAPEKDLALASAAADALAATMQMRQPPTLSVSARRSSSLDLPAEMRSQATVEAVR